MLVWVDDLLMLKQCISSRTYTIALDIIDHKYYVLKVWKHSWLTSLDLL